MKIRSGFVSNSSTSSFCVIGVVRSEKLDREAFVNAAWPPEEDEEYSEDDYYSIFDELGWLDDGEGEVLGKYLISVSDSGYESKPLDRIQKCIDEVKRAFKAYEKATGKSLGEPKLICGTRYS